uniref:Uncharacterized protein n=1 Tax=Cacopsylla melanoneura TaxID=428564 RepID=A0A8D8SP20_9HEMI
MRNPLLTVRTNQAVKIKTLLTNPMLTLQRVNPPVGMLINRQRVEKRKRERERIELPPKRLEKLLLLLRLVVVLVGRVRMVRVYRLEETRRRRQHKRVEEEKIGHKVGESRSKTSDLFPQRSTTGSRPLLLLLLLRLMVNTLLLVAMDKVNRLIKSLLQLLVRLGITEARVMELPRQRQW